MWWEKKECNLTERVRAPTRGTEEKFVAVFRGFSRAGCDFFLLACVGMATAWSECISWKVIWTCRGRRFFLRTWAWLAPSSLMNESGEIFFSSALSSGVFGDGDWKHMFCILGDLFFGAVDLFIRERSRMHPAGDERHKKTAQRSGFPNAIFISFIQAIK